MSLNKITSVAAAALIAGAVHAQDKPDLKDPKVRSAYALGVDIGTNLKRQPVELDAKAIAAGLQDAFAGKPGLTPAELKEALSELNKLAAAAAEAKGKADAAKNLKAGEEFLAANGKKEGVKTTASGLQYKVIKSGTGASPKATDTVKVHYHGTLIDGSVFDSSVDRGEPVEFPLNGVIPGWTEGVQLMKVGDKWTFYIPSKLAYGENGPGPIGPNAVLVFDVELLGIGGK